MKNKDGWLSAARDTLPVLAGYLVLGFGFGLLMNSRGFSFWWSVSMSLFIYAGSMQYLAADLLTGGASLLTAALTTLLVNARHLFYGVSMLERYGAVRRKPYLIFGLTDETYSLVCAGERKEDSYYFRVTLLDHLYWVGGTALGALAGSFLHFNTEGIDFALTALFLTVALEQWLSGKDHVPALIGLGGSVLCLALFGADSFLLPAMGVILLLLMLSRKRGEEAQKDA